MFVTSNDFKAVRNYYAKELNDLYSSGELKIILKYLFLKHFDATTSEYLLSDDKLLSESDLLFFHQALKRLRSNEPFQYVIGESEFYDLLLKCDSRALIPRPETEELVDWILTNNADPSSLMDVCSGSGCIALAVKNNRKQTKVFALELSEGALALTQDNAQFTGLDLQLIQADAVTANYADLVKEKLEIIVSNPPYIPNVEREIMKENVLDFEPEMALFVENDDPLLFYREILERSQYVLSDNGWVYFEVHEDLGKDVVALFEQRNFVNIELRKDLQGKDRMVRGQMVTCAHERPGS